MVGTCLAGTSHVGHVSEREPRAEDEHVLVQACEVREPKPVHSSQQPPARAAHCMGGLAARQTQTHPLSAGPCRDGSSARALGKSPSASYSRAIEGSRFVAGLCDCLGLHQLVVSSTSWPWTKLACAPRARPPSAACALVITKMTSHTRTRGLLQLRPRVCERAEFQLYLSLRISACNSTKFKLKFAGSNAA